MNIPIGIKKVATICILQNASNLLLLLRNKEPNKNTYSPVGGKLEPFETPLQAAIRECYEETGLHVNNLKFCGILSDSSPTNYNWMSWIYIAQIPYSKPQKCKEGILKWIPIIQIPNLPQAPTDKFIYQYALQGKPFAFSTNYDANLKILEMTECFEQKKLI